MCYLSRNQLLRGISMNRDEAPSSCWCWVCVPQLIMTAMERWEMEVFVPPLNTSCSSNVNHMIFGLTLSGICRWFPKSLERRYPSTMAFKCLSFQKTEAKQSRIFCLDGLWRPCVRCAALSGGSWVRVTLGSWRNSRQSYGGSPKESIWMGFPG